MPFTYSPTSLKELETALTIPRLTRYLAESKGNMQLAIQLYEHNTLVSAAMFATIQPLEVAFRNGIHRVLATDLGRPDWYDTGALQSPEPDAVNAARETLRIRGKPQTPDRIIAELTFGFWVRLLNKKYEKTLWVTHLWKCFPHGPKPDRDKMLARFRRIRDLRNRIAHHEPIFFENLETEYTRVLSTLEWICPVSACWVRATHPISTLTKAK
jgi:hypothetical protein